MNILADVAGVVADIPVKVGDRLDPGQTVMILECMKMEIPVDAPQGGTLSAIHVEVGAQVKEGQRLADLDA